MRATALIFVLLSLLLVPLTWAADEEMGKGGQVYRLVTQDGQVVAEFILSERQNVLIELENGVAQVRLVDAAAEVASPGGGAEAGQQGSSMERAKALLQQEKYDAVISLLSDEALRRPSDFELNLLLARAQVEKSAQQKEQGDSSYKLALQSIYQTGQRLYNMNRSHPEPYYIVAKSLYLNNRASKAYDVVRKAVYFAPYDPHYQLLFAELSVEQAETWQDDGDSGDFVANMYQQALAAYETALNGFKHDDKRQKMIRAKIERLQRLTSKR